MNLTSVQVAIAVGVTLRELQWWDEQGIVSPLITSHRRLYSAEEVETIRRVKMLRKAGIPLYHVKQYLRWNFTSAMKITVPTVISGVLVVPK